MVPGLDVEALLLAATAASAGSALFTAWRGRQTVADFKTLLVEMRAKEIEKIKTAVVPIGGLPPPAVGRPVRRREPAASRLYPRTHPSVRGAAPPPRAYPEPPPEFREDPEPPQDPPRAAPPPRRIIQEEEVTRRRRIEETGAEEEPPQPPREVVDVPPARAREAAGPAQVVILEPPPARDQRPPPRPAPLPERASSAPTPPARPPPPPPPAVQLPPAPSLRNELLASRKNLDRVLEQQVQKGIISQRTYDYLKRRTLTQPSADTRKAAEALLQALEAQRGAGVLSEETYRRSRAKLMEQIN